MHNKYHWYLFSFENALFETHKTEQWFKMPFLFYPEHSIHFHCLSLSSEGFSPSLSVSHVSNSRVLGRIALETIWVIKTINSLLPS